MRVDIYARTSTQHQDVMQQVHYLRQWVLKNGFEKDIAEFELLVEKYNFNVSDESLESMTDKKYSMMERYHINNEKQFKRLNGKSKFS